jgi:hypothetical protein
LANFFDGLSSVSDVKCRYHALAKTYHPDLGGCLETMKTINSQYHEALKQLNNKQEDGHVYRYNVKIEQNIVDKISELLTLDDVLIELIGTWIWISGETKKHKEQLKEKGCRWHTKRLCWYWRPAGYSCKQANPGSLELLAKKYGSQMFKQDPKKQLVSA